jgi:hypothetical protein
MICDGIFMGVRGQGVASDLYLSFYVLPSYTITMAMLSVLVIFLVMEVSPNYFSLILSGLSH